MEVERNLVVISPAGAGGTVGRRPSLTSCSTTRFEIRKSSDAEANKNLEPRFRSTKSKFCYRTADLVMNMLVLFPLSIGFWRGVWQLMEYYSSPEVWGVGPWLSMGLGYLIPFVLYVFQEPLKRQVAPGPMTFVPFYVLSRSLLLIHSFGSVNQWRGLWQLMDDETGKGPESALVSLIVGLFFSLVLRTFSNVLAPPLLVVVDEASTIHDCPLRFKTSPERKWCYLFDCTFSVFVVPSLTVCCWRGVWNLADLYLYPDDPAASALSSMGFGYLLCIILCSTQPLICELVCSLKGILRLAVIDACYFVGFIGCVFAWRGVWNSYNIYIVFETPYLSEWVTLIIGTIGTVLFGCVSIVVVRGIAIDGEIEKDEAAEWLIPYISHLRERHSEVPFPEPAYRRTRPEKLDHLDGVTQPLKKANNVPNSHGADDGDPTRRKYPANPPPKVRLSQIPHIDSSSEDELGERETLNPNPELDGQDEEEQDEGKKIVSNPIRQA
ncbi:hypothetical protein Fcan01_06000 [Folsomia candida]|uniref:Uncharacterized protein n=1 Tax=Folsomia candida TaxID=158441 RepID=A0A226ER23_FOLCA|nr:hypothetical protein Fcan01_06000 [Folsomia candida]